MLAQGLEALDPPPGSLLFIENVGNLVCPALFDLGEAAKVVVISVTEGEDKPLKYPHMFAAADLVVINKIDLLPYVEFDVDACSARRPQRQPRRSRSWRCPRRPGAGSKAGTRGARHLHGQCSTPKNADRWRQIGDPLRRCLTRGLCARSRQAGNAKPTDALQGPCQG